MGWLDVALLAEGVDRNINDDIDLVTSIPSPSSRRAWIEMLFRGTPGIDTSGRPPRGGRG